ncbi:hypothetical protein MNBD_GAMMA18-151, partial [hydrothermal vent metagenome]
MTSEKLQLLLNAEKLTEKMYVLASDENWQEMLVLQDERDHCLKDYDALPVSSSEQQATQVALQRIVKLDKQLRQLTQASLQGLTEKIGDMKVSRQAQKAYLQNSGNL